MTIFRVRIYNTSIARPLKYRNKLIHEEYAHSNRHADKIASHWENLPVKIDKTLYRVVNSKQGWIDFLNKKGKEQNDG